MNKNILTLGLLIFGSGCFAVPIEDALRKAAEPNYLSVILSLIFVICIIYASGIICNKLNNFSIKTLKTQNKDFIKDKISIISTTPLGANRTLHVVELNGKKMLIGASTNSIHLIKDLSDNDNENIQEEIIKENFETEEKKNQSETQGDDEDFGLYKKYLG